MGAINKRLQLLVDESGLSKTEWAKRLNVTPQFISGVCLGKFNLSDRTVSDICREFRVNEIWLRTGEGEMFVQRTREEEIEDAVNRLLSGEPDSFKAALIVALSKLEDSQWNKIEDFAMGLLKAREGVEKQPETPEERADRLEQELQAEREHSATLEKELAQLEGRGKPEAV